MFPLIGYEPKYIYCLLFGALISPTDPIAVLGILKKAGVPKKLETKIVGESLFNDGVGVVVFLTIASIAFGGKHGDDHATQLPAQPIVVSQASLDTTDVETSEDTAAGESGHHDEGNQKGWFATVSDVGEMFVQEVVGGILFGLLLGYVTFWLLRSIDNYEVEVMITLACVMGGYSLASWLHMSAPLAIVVAGLIVGNDTVRGTAMSAQTEQYVDQFWELVDMLLNAVLFVLIGLEILILEVTTSYVLAALIAIGIVLGSRYLSLVLPVRFFSKRLEFVPFTTTVMTWGGLRGGISIALALSLPHSLNVGPDEMFRDLFVTVTYGVVVFSIIVQGLTVGFAGQSFDRLGRSRNSVREQTLNMIAPTGDVISQTGYNRSSPISNSATVNPQTKSRMSETQTEAWTIQRLLQWTTDFFTRKELDSPRLAAEVLLAAALGCQRIDIYARFNEIPVEPQLGNFRGWVKRHGAGEPVAYLVGHKEFYSLRFDVDQNVLIPRPETEHVVMAALDCAKDFSGPLRIADVGTGSACIAVTLATQLELAQVVALDLSAGALNVARANVERHQVAERVELVESDLLSALPADQGFDLIVSNPPYVGRSEVGTLNENVAKYEPEMALYGGDEGTEIIVRLIEQSAGRLSSGGYLIFEFSPMIAVKCKELVEASGQFSSCEIQKDYSQHQRLIVAKKS